MRKIYLNFRDRRPRCGTHPDKAKHRVTCAGHQRDVQRHWERWYEGAETYLHKPAQKVPGKQKKAQSDRGQVRLKTHRRSAAAPIAHDVLKLARQVVDLVRQLRRHAHQAGGLGVVLWNVVHFWRRVRLLGTALLHDVRTEIVRHCRLPSLEQVCRLATHLKEETRQAHEDDG